LQGAPEAQVAQESFGKPHFLINMARGIGAGVDFHQETKRSPRLDVAVDAGVIHLSKNDVQASPSMST